MSKISAREKTLLVALLFTALAVGGFFLIVKPAIDERMQNQILLAEAQTEKQALIAQLDMLNVLEKNLEQAKTKIKQKEPKYYSEALKTWEADKYIVSLMEKHSLKATLMQIAGPNQYTIKVAGAVDEAGNKAEDTETLTEAKIVTITVSCDTTLENMTSFLDNIKKLDQQIVVRAWSYTIDDKGFKGDIVIEMYCK